MVLQKTDLKSGLAPLVILWLAAHAVFLGLILSLKFLTAKTVTLLLLIAAAFWLLGGRRNPAMLPAPPGMV
jgi:hypothetical protein